VLERLKGTPATPGQKPAILVYLGVLLQKGKLNALESAELARYTLQMNWCFHLAGCRAVLCDEMWSGP